MIRFNFEKHFLSTLNLFDNYDSFFYLKSARIVFLSKFKKQKHIFENYKKLF